MNCRVELSIHRSPILSLLPWVAGQCVEGVKTLFGFGHQIRNSVDQKPDGLLLHENFIMSLIPLYLGMRQSWRENVGSKANIAEVATWGERSIANNNFDARLKS